MSHVWHYKREASQIESKPKGPTWELFECVRVQASVLPARYDAVAFEKTVRQTIVLSFPTGSSPPTAPLIPSGGDLESSPVIRRRCGGRSHGFQLSLTQRFRGLFAVL